MEGTIHLDSLLNKSKHELSKLKRTDTERLDELASHDETKSLAYLSKIFEELGNQKGEDINSQSDHLDDLFNSSALTKYLKFYLKNGNTDLIFIS